MSTSVAYIVQLSLYFLSCQQIRPEKGEGTVNSRPSFSSQIANKCRWCIKHEEAIWGKNTVLVSFVWCNWAARNKCSACRNLKVSREFTTNLFRIKYPFHRVLSLNIKTDHWFRLPVGYCVSRIILIVLETSNVFFKLLGVIVLHAVNGVYLVID